MYLIPLDLSHRSVAVKGDGKMTPPMSKMTADFCLFPLDDESS